jgi:hypothetical protein
MLELINELNTLIQEQTIVNHGINSFYNNPDQGSGTFCEYVKEQTQQTACDLEQNIRIFEQPAPSSVFQSINHYTSQDTHMTSCIP